MIGTAERMDAGNRMLIGRPRFEIMILPTSRNVAAVMASIERLKLNHVPQNTPVTSAKSITLTSCRIFMLEHSIHERHSRSQSWGLQEPCLEEGLHAACDLIDCRHQDPSPEAGQVRSEASLPWTSCSYLLHGGESVCR